MGSVYLILGTNLGARLGFLVTLCGLAGWMALMGIIWMIYGIGLQGPLGSWAAVPGRTVLQDTAALSQAGVLDSSVEIPEGTSFTDEAALVADRFAEEGWEQLDVSSPAAGQAGASAGEFLEETGAFDAGEYQVTAGLRHRRRAVPDDRQLRPVRRAPRAALRGRRGRRPSSRPATSRGGRRRRARSTRASSASTST